MTRRVTLADGMIVVAALAAAFAGARACMAYFGWGSPHDRVGWWAGWVRLASVVALALTLAYFPLRLRPPRPSLRRVTRQPGTVACCAVVLAIVLSIPAGLQAQNLFVMVTSYVVIAHSVAAAWMAMILTVGWRPRQDWVDGMGWCLGGFWIASLIFLASLPFL
jgi:hypothetical protein